MAIGTILLAVGRGDDRRLDRLIDALLEEAEPTGASVVLYHVFTEQELGSVRDQFHEEEASPSELSADALAGRLTNIREIADELSAADIDYEVRGSVAEERGDAIVALASTVDADRVIVGGRGRSPTGKAVFGSTAQHVLTSAPCPVLFVRGG